ncbi:exported hypothetical protein [Actinacidiphila cocklensis]|uniref:Uncharacterized protein n=1 Tax=Actinacidiphila cocklensis TaxID=887465 RepID=A0A9W4E5U7_9ACTN|nr:exported hypothetical protein [Actinacidiphila cocklensis]
MLRMTSSMSNARPSTIAPCVASMSTITSAVRTATRSSPRARGKSIGSRMPKGTPSSTLPPICLTVSRSAGWSRYARMDAPGRRFVWIKESDDGDGTSVTFASAAAKATMQTMAAAMTAARASVGPRVRRCSTGGGVLRPRGRGRGLGVRFGFAAGLFGFAAGLFGFAAGLVAGFTADLDFGFTAGTGFAAGFGLGFAVGRGPRIRSSSATRIAMAVTPPCGRLLGAAYPGPAVVRRVTAYDGRIPTHRRWG